jgi:hypothetical protein
VKFPVTVVNLFIVEKTVIVRYEYLPMRVKNIQLEE